MRGCQDGYCASLSMLRKKIPSWSGNEMLFELGNHFRSGLPFGLIQR